ncbi:hypothetical protein [Flavobacterium sp.]|uniref:hypothetical protein n=1 Tax=Flavobacterium sp. TaxID=239 RepID=UPI003263BCDE
MNYILIIIALLSAFTFAFIIGIVLGLYIIFKIEFDEEDEDDETINSLQDLYCFECEIEMPVKEKNGRLYCSNCGLYH